MAPYFSGGLLHMLNHDINRFHYFLTYLTCIKMFQDVFHMITNCKPGQQRETPDATFMKLFLTVDE